MGILQAQNGVLPPESNTGVEPVTVAVDWWHGTRALSVADLTREDLPGAGVPDLERLLGHGLARCLGSVTGSRGSHTLGPTGHYQSGVAADDGGWSVKWDGSGGARRTALLTVTGAGWSSIPPEGHPAALGALQGLTEGRTSRLDLAGDAAAGARHPRWYFDRRVAARTRTRRGAWTLTERGDGGETLYVGSRTSERFLRIYRRPGAIRHELELKGDLARLVAAAAAAGTPLAALWSAEYARLVVWP
jgi:hypothetical protein